MENDSLYMTLAKVVLPHEFCRMLEDFYHVNANTFEKQYKDMLSDYRTWTEAEHATEWLVFPDNIGENMAIDETSLSIPY